jgi:cytochrome P450
MSAGTTSSDCLGMQAVKFSSTARSLVWWKGTHHITRQHLLSQLLTSRSYAALFGEAPSIQERDNLNGLDEHTSPFNRRMAWSQKTDQLQKILPTVVADARGGIEAISQDLESRTNPFDSIYRLVFKLTIRLVGAKELAEDPILRRKFEGYFTMLDETAGPLSAMFPRFPWPSMIKRFYAGARMYMILDQIVKKRKQLSERVDDPLQNLLERNDSMTEIVYFVTGALFAGQLNTGVNAAYVLCYLATSPAWLENIRTEVEVAAAKYGTKETNASLLDKLSSLSLEAWESEFPLIQLCLRDSIRLNMPGVFFRKNLSNRPIPTGHGNEVIPPGSFPIYHVADAHRDPEVWAEPNKWDPARYLPDRAEDKIKPRIYQGWGVGRHPCQGMRFAKLEVNIITAFFVAALDFAGGLEDENGLKLDEMENGNINDIANNIPKKPFFLRFTRRNDPSATTA